MTVLITAFGPFDGGSNASEAMLRAFERRGPSAAAARLPLWLDVLPVDTVAAPAILGQLLAEQVY